MWKRAFLEQALCTSQRNVLLPSFYKQEHRLHYSIVAWRVPWTEEPDGRVEGHVFIFSCNYPKVATCCWTTIYQRMLDPTHTKNDTPCPRANEKPQQDGRGDKITFRITPHTCQRCLECSNKILCTPGPRDHRDLARPAFEYLRVYCGSTGQQLPAPGTRSPATADLDHRVWHKPSWRRSLLALP